MTQILTIRRLLGLAVALFLLCQETLAQSPNAIPYQAVARNSSGNLLQNQSVRVRFSIHEGTASGAVVYQETHTATTNNLGLFSVNIGQGSPMSGTFAGINWGSGPKFTQVELDPSGGTSYLDMGTVQMLSVPYALYAATSGSAANEHDPQVSSATANAVPKWNGSTLTDGTLYDDGTNIGIGTSSPAQKLDIVGTVKTVGFQMPTGAASGYVLQSDASGNASWVASSTLATATPSKIQDTDADTKIETEKNADEDAIRLSVGGTEYYKINAGKIEVNNTGASIYIGESAGAADDLSGNNGNVGIGANALQSATKDAGDNGNTAIGRRALQRLTTGRSNSAVGFDALRNATGEQNTALGYGAGTGTANYSGSKNTFLGYAAGAGARGSENTFVGYATGINNIGSGNVFIGKSAGGVETGDNKLYIDNSSTSNPLIWGDFSSNYLNFNANVGIGTTSPSQKLDVVGTIKTVGFQMPTGAVNGYVLQSDVGGNASWVAPTSLSVTEIDPQVVSSNTNYVSKWDGSALTDGLIYDDGSNIGIGTTSPAQKLDIVGTTKTVGFQMPTGAASGYVLQSDASGNASWVVPTSLSVTGDNLGNHTAGQNIILGGNFLSSDGSNYGLRFSSGLNYTEPGSSIAINLGNNTNDFIEMAFKTTNRDWRLNAGDDQFQLVHDGIVGGPSSPFVVEKQSGNNRVYIKGEYVGIGHNNPTELLDVNGKTKTTNFQMTAGATNGYVLQSDAGGNGTWVAPSAAFPDAQTLGLSGTTLSIASGNSVDISQKQIKDTDGDTKIQVEESADEDKIRFDLAGTERWVMTGSRLEPVNTGNSVFIGTTAGANDDLSGNNNVGIGNSAMITNTTGESNVAVGSQALLKNTEGKQNVALGRQAMFENETGNNNTAVGFGARQFGTSGSGNTAVGYAAGYTATGSNCVFIGYLAGYSETGDNKLYITNTSTSSPLIWGDFASSYVNINGNLGIGTTSPAQKLDVVGTVKTVGFQMPTGAGAGLVLQSDASGNASWVAPTTLTTPTPSKIQDADADTKIETEKNADEDAIRLSIAGTEYYIINAGKIEVNNTGGSIYMGEAAGAADNFSTSAGNVGIGANALQNANGATIANIGNTALGKRALQQLTTGTRCTAVGYDALRNATGNNNTAVGNSAGAGDANYSGSDNTFLGCQAGLEATGSNNTMVGYGAGNFHSGSGNVFIGHLAGSRNYSSDNELYIDNSNTDYPLIWGDFSSNYININGNVGINTSSPTQAQLVVNGSESTNIGGYGFINDNGNTGTSSGTHNYSIYASDRVAGSEFNAHSDARIKSVRGRSDNAADLQTLMQLKITDYTLIDTVAKGNKPYKKVIAQEVEQVYPQAVSTIPGVMVPDIYQLAQIENGFVSLENAGLKPGEHVKLIFGQKQETAEVMAASPKGFQTNLKGETGQVFVYGREVSDFRTVDYEAISILNVSATQALVKRLSDLEKQHAETKRQNEQLQGQVQDLNQWREKVEAILQAQSHK